MSGPERIPIDLWEDGGTLFDLFDDNGTDSLRRRLDKGIFITPENLAAILTNNPDAIHPQSCATTSCAHSRAS